MKFGKVLTYKDIDEAKRLVGKKVISSDVFKEIDTQADILASIGGRLVILTGVVEGNPFPFRVSNGTVYQFIREVIEEESDPHYEPYDLSDPAVRDSLRGRWIIYTKGDEYTTEEVIIVGFGKQGKNYWKVIIGTGEISATELLEFYAFDDGTPCGRRVDKEMSSPVLTRDNKEDEK